MTTASHLTRHARCPNCGQVFELDQDRRYPDHQTRNWGGTERCHLARAFVPDRLSYLADPADPHIPAPRNEYVDPAIEVVTADDIGDGYLHEQALKNAAEMVAKMVPPRYRHATVTNDQAKEWVRALVRSVDDDPRTRPRIDRGPSLMLLGPTGTGKTHMAFGIIRALAVSGLPFTWRFTTAADMYAKLRPRPRQDTEEEFERFAESSFLVVDDLGAAKGTEWNEEINYRLINHRYEFEMPTVVTSNVPPKNLADVLGERVTSRLIEMSTRVVLKGADRRLGGAA